MLYIPHRAGQPAARRLLASSALSALLTPFILLSPLATGDASAQVQTQAPKKAFGERVLTDDNDSVGNDTTIDLTEDSDFGGGTDLLINNGVITIGAKATSPVSVSLLSLEQFRNNGLIDMRNGHVGDVLTLSTDYDATAVARLALDVTAAGADKLVVGGAAFGKTAITLGVTGQTAALTGDKGPILVQAGGSTKADAFRIDNYEVGFVRYSLVFDAEAKTFRLKGVAGQRAFETLKISEGASTVWRRSADAWSAHVANLRDAGHDANGAGVWAQTYGESADREDKVAAKDRVVDVAYDQTTYGGQMGVDLINAGLDDGRVLIGLTGGYADSKMRFSGVAGQEMKLSVANIGGYLSLTRSGYFINVLAKADRQSIKAQGQEIAAKFDGVSYGAQLEAGARTESEDEGLAFEQLLGVSYVSTRLDDTTILAKRLDFNDDAGFLAKLGLRGTARGELFGGTLSTYGAAFVVHDFTVKNGLTLVSGDQSEHLSRDGGHTYGQVAMGVSYRAGATLAFLEANGDYGSGREVLGLRLGARVGF